MKSGLCLLKTGNLNIFGLEQVDSELDDISGGKKSSCYTSTCYSSCYTSGNPGVCYCFATAGG